MLSNLCYLLVDIKVDILCCIFALLTLVVPRKLVSCCQGACIVCGFYISFVFFVSRV